jgi:hypothetical protein
LLLITENSVPLVLCCLIRGLPPIVGCSRVSVRLSTQGWWDVTLACGTPEFSSGYCHGKIWEKAI